MSERNKHIDELFRKSLSGHTEEPPPHVWDAIEQKLDNLPPKAPTRIWWFWSIVGIILVSTTAIVASYNTDNSGTKLAQNIVEEQVVVAEEQPNRQPQNNEEQQTTLNPAEELKQEQTPQTELTITKEHTDNDQNAKPIKSEYTGTNKKGAILEQKRTNSGLGDIKSPISETKKNKLREEQPIAQLGPASPQNIVTSIDVADKKRTTVHNRMPKLKEEPLYLAANTAKQKSNVSIADATVQSVTLPQISSNKTEPGAQTINKNTQVTNMPSVLQPTSSSLLAADNSTLLAQAGTTAGMLSNIPAPLNTETAQQEIEPSPRTNFEDTTKKKKRKKASDTTANEQEDALDQSSGEIVDIAYHPLPIELGIKAGYSTGTNNNWRADKLVIAGYAAYRVSDKFSIVFQPTYLSGKSKTGDLTDANTSYYEVTSQSFDSSSRLARGHVDSSITTPNPPDTLYRTYTYTHQYDSVHVYYGVDNKPLWDIELPLLVQYKVHKNISILAGVSATYSSVLQTKEEVNRYNMSQTHTEDHAPATFFVTAPNQPLPSAPAPKAYEDLFTNSGTPYSNFQPRTIINAKNFFRYGYMIGVSATLKERWMFDLLWHQTGVDATQVPDKNLQKIYTQPYIRMTIGYKLLK